jgi:Ca-activated chloride channel homolog
MNFAHPERLWLLTLLLPLLIWTIRGRWRRRKSWQALAQRGRPSRDGTPGIAASIACLIIALAQPRWGNLPAGALPPGHDLVFMIDVSRSMGAEDAVPNRLAVALELAEGLVRRLGQDPSNRAAVVAFAGRGVLRCPLTENLGAVLDAIRRLQPGSVKPDGTDLGAALDAAIEALAVDPREHAQGRAVIVFSDGEDHADRWSSRLERLRQQDIVVHAVAIGDADQGHPVPADKTAQPLLFEGKKVLSKRFDTALEAIARGTGGAVVKFGLASGDLGNLYKSKIEPLARSRRDASRLADRAERFPLLLLTAFVFLLLGYLPAGRGWNWSWRGTWGWRRSLKSLGPTSLLFALAVLGTGAIDVPQKIAAESAESAVARGKAAYEKGRFEEASAAFEAAMQRAPKSVVARYNAAATLFQLKEYTRARERYLEARQGADASLRTKIDYALGNTALALGEIAAAIRSYDDCIDSTSRGNALDIVRQDAEINRRFAVEQAQAPAIAEGQNPDDPSQGPRQNGRRGANPRQSGEDSSTDGQAEPGTGSSGTSPDADDQDERNRPPSRRRRTGGAGGSGRTSQGNRGDTPDDRLDAALEHIREAETRRLPDDLPPESPTAVRKDW